MGNIRSFMEYLGAGGLFLDSRETKSKKNEKIIALFAFIASVLFVYIIFADFLSVHLYAETPCRLDLQDCSEGQICADLWVKCIPSEKPYRYDPVTSFLFGKKQCEQPNIYRSVCIDKEFYDGFDAGKN